MTDTAGDPDVIVNAGDFPETPVPLLEHAALHALGHARPTRLSELSVTMLSDEAIRAMNREYLGKDRTTDVIAFTLGDDSESGLLGDVYVGFEQARRQAAAADVTLDEELVRLTIHGVLHVLGHEHPEGSGREDSAMYALQERLVAEVVETA